LKDVNFPNNFLTGVLQKFVVSTSQKIDVSQKQKTYIIPVHPKYDHDDVLASSAANIYVNPLK